MSHTRRNHICTPMKSRITLLVFASMLMSSLFAQTPTWSENTACIFYTNCVKCHHPGGPGPFSLLDYNSAYTARYQIKAAVQTRYMPPWPPDRSYQTHAHERSLSQQEIDIIAAWVDAGAPQGDTNLAPTPPVISNGSQLPQVDWSARIPTYTNQATIDDYRCFVIPTGFAAGQNISGIEIIPGNTSMVHHVLIFQDTAQALVTLDNNDPDPGYSLFGGTGSNTSKLIAGWVPGSQPFIFPSGMGVRIEPNAYIVLQIHYPQGSDGSTDSTRVNLQFAPGSIRNVQLSPVLSHNTNMVNGPIAIAPNSSTTYYEQFTLPGSTAGLDKYTVLSIAPHMHKVARSVKVYAITPLTDTVPLISIPQWNFKWQGQYSFRQPMVFEEGTIVRSEGFFDNTINNPDAPNVNNWVYAGEATTDEMFLVYFGFLPYQNGDENIIVDTSTVRPTWNNCQYMLGEAYLSVNAAVTLYPNPAADYIRLSWYAPAAANYHIHITDMLGRIIYTSAGGGPGAEQEQNLQIDIAALPPGAYSLSLQQAGAVYTRKFIVMR